jgi:alkylation response protein AidB-like acyl-CoA dehydrogenase
VLRETTESVELREYRLKARAWLAENMPRVEGRDPHEDDEPIDERVNQCKRLQNHLYGGGYSGISFPIEYGGQGLSIEHESVFLEEAEGYDVPIAFFGVSINILGATLNAFGNHEQKATHLPNILSGRQRWLQLLSEPSGGSDVAGILTSATRDGDCYVINGQKIWSTGAHLSDFALCPVRTRWDVPKHKGISVFIVDLSTPGIEIHRIKEISGSARFCQEYLTDVVVPAANLVGEENGGWRVIRGLLEIEHAWVGRGGARSAESQGIDALVSMVKSSARKDDVGVRRKVTDLYVALEVQRLMAARTTRGIATGKITQNYGSLLKLGNASLIQHRAEVGLTLAAGQGVAWEPGDHVWSEWSAGFLASRSSTIAGGTNEIQKNNVSEKVLGLPREDSREIGIPFNQVPHN